MAVAISGPSSARASQCLQFTGDRSHGNWRGAFDFCDGVFVVLADVDQVQFLSGVDSLLYFGGGDFPEAGTLLFRDLDGFVALLAVLG